MARNHYPLLKQMGLNAETSRLRTSNLSRTYLPQLNIMGQASYQSDVTALPIQLPGVQVPELSKDQYRLYADLSQVIYDGGATAIQKSLQGLNSNIEQHGVEVELYRLTERVNQVFFSILLSQNQLRQVTLLREDLSSSVSQMSSLVRHGAALSSNLDLLQAELLKVGQREMELTALIGTQRASLGTLIGKELSDSTTLLSPPPPSEASGIRPEIRLLEWQQRALIRQESILGSKNRPRLYLFLQAGYGRPALNMLDNSIRTYYVGGLRLQWNLSGLYTLRNEKQLLKLGSQSLELQKEIFYFNNRLVTRQQRDELTKIGLLMQTDQEIVKLREKISASAKARMLQGVITSSDYLRERHAEEQAREQMEFHKIQLIAYQYQLLHQSGNAPTEISNEK